MRHFPTKHTIWTEIESLLSCKTLSPHGKPFSLVVDCFHAKPFSLSKLIVFLENPFLSPRGKSFSLIVLFSRKALFPSSYFPETLRLVFTRGAVFPHRIIALLNLAAHLQLCPKTCKVGLRLKTRVEGAADECRGIVRYVDWYSSNAKVVLCS